MLCVCIMNFCNFQNICSKDIFTILTLSKDFQQRSVAKRNSTAVSIWFFPRFYSIQQTKLEYSQDVEYFYISSLRP